MTGAFPFNLPLRGPRFTVERGSGTALEIRRHDDGETVGTIEVDMSGRTLHIESLCVEKPHRGYGAGSEAARLLGDAAASLHVTAWAPPDLGLAVYFWFRMGFHPVPGEGPNAGLLFERSPLTARTAPG